MEWLATLLILFSIIGVVRSKSAEWAALSLLGLITGWGLQCSVHRWETDAVLLRQDKQIQKLITQVDNMKDLIVAIHPPDEQQEKK